jgi:hypothetical protein
MLFRSRCISTIGERLPGEVISAMPKISPRILWVSLAVVVLLVVTAFLVISSRVHAYLRSEDFRRLVSQKTGDAFRAEAQYAPLRWAGPSVFSDTLQATGRPGSIVSDVEAHQVRASVNWRAIFNGAWRVDEVTVMHLRGVFRPGSPEDGTNAGDPPVASSGFAAWLPKRFELGRLQVGKARLEFLGSDGSSVVTLVDSTLRVEPNGDGWAINGNGGTLTLPALPTMNVMSYRTRIQGGTFFLTDAELRLGDMGRISASGEFSDRSDLHVQWEQVDVEPFLNEEWKKRISGVMAGTADLNWPSSGLADGTITGKFRMTDGLVQNVSTLEEVAKFTGAPQFRRMPVQEFSGDYRWFKGDLTLTNLVLESKGLLRVEGTCLIAADGTVDGQLRVGVTPQSLQWLPGSRERVFTVSQNGYLWTNVRLGGTVQNLNEDLSARLVKAARDEVIQQGVRTIEKLPEATKEGVKDVLNILTPLVR